MELKYSSIDDRLGFVRKVYGILTIQLVITTLWIYTVLSTDTLMSFVLNQYLLVVFLIFGLLAIELTLICYRKLARRVPVNYILLGAFTCGEAWCLGYLCLFFNHRDVFSALIMTIAVTMALQGYAQATNEDFTVKGGMLWVLSVVLALLLIFGLILRQSTLGFYAVTSVVLIILGVFMIYDI